MAGLWNADTHARDLASHYGQVDRLSPGQQYYASLMGRRAMEQLPGGANSYLSRDEPEARRRRIPGSPDFLVRPDPRGGAPLPTNWGRMLYRGGIGPVVQALPGGIPQAGPVAASVNRAFSRGSEDFRSFHRQLAGGGRLSPPRVNPFASLTATGLQDFASGYQAVDPASLQDPMGYRDAFQGYRQAGQALDAMNGLAPLLRFDEGIAQPHQRATRQLQGTMQGNLPHLQQNFSRHFPEQTWEGALQQGLPFVAPQAPREMAPQGGNLGDAQQADGGLLGVDSVGGGGGGSSGAFGSQAGSLD